jgi:uncharacterized protein (DUF1778 family)
MSSAAPVSFRMPEDDIAFIDRAAKLLGRSRTEFVREAAMRAAEMAILDETVVKLKADEFDWLAKHIDNPGEPPKALRDLLTEARKTATRAN